MKDSKQILILPGDEVDVHGGEGLRSQDGFVVIGLSESKQEVTLRYENDETCHYEEAKFPSEELTVLLQPRDPRGQVKKKGRLSSFELIRAEEVEKYLKMKETGQLDEWQEE